MRQQRFGSRILPLLYLIPLEADQSYGHRTFCDNLLQGQEFLIQALRYSLSSHGGNPLGIFLNPSMSSEYAISSDLYPKFRKASETPYDRTASAILPI